jgi:oligoendopeptidase F
MISKINLLNLAEFRKLPYLRPDMDKLSDAFRRCRLRLRLSMSAHAAADAVRELQPALIDFFTAEAIARNRHDRKLTDDAWQSETAFFDSAMSQVQAWTQETYAALTASRFAEDLEAELGDGLFREARMLAATVNDRMIADLGEENRLESAYVEKISEISVKLNGNSYTLTELEPYLQSSDKQMRRASHRALCRAYEENHEWLDACFDQLVNVRCG